MAYIWSPDLEITLKGSFPNVRRLLSAGPRVSGPFGAPASGRGALTLPPLLAPLLAWTQARYMSVQTYDARFNPMPYTINDTAKVPGEL